MDQQVCVPTRLFSGFVTRDICEVIYKMIWSSLHQWVQISPAVFLEPTLPYNFIQEPILAPKLSLPNEWQESFMLNLSHLSGVKFRMRRESILDQEFPSSKRLKFWMKLKCWRREGRGDPSGWKGKWLWVQMIELLIWRSSSKSWFFGRAGAMAHHSKDQSWPFMTLLEVSQCVDNLSLLSRDWKKNL